MTVAMWGLGGAQNTSTESGMALMLFIMATMVSTFAESVAHFQLPPTMKVRFSPAGLRPDRGTIT